MSKISNVLLMLGYLSTGRKYSISELAERLEVSPRMIRVYKDELEKAGIYIDTVKGPYGGYVLEQNTDLPRQIAAPDIINIKDMEIFDAVNLAVKENKKCLILYSSRDGKSAAQRVIHPFELIMLGREWGIAAYCELKKSVRVFYINRIKEISFFVESKD